MLKYHKITKYCATRPFFNRFEIISICWSLQTRSTYMRSSFLMVNWYLIDSQGCKHSHLIRNSENFRSTLAWQLLASTSQNASFWPPRKTINKIKWFSINFKLYLSCRKERNRMSWSSWRSNILVHSFFSCKLWNISVSFHAAGSNCVFSTTSFSHHRWSSLLLGRFQLLCKVFCCEKTPALSMMETRCCYERWCDNLQKTETDFCRCIYQP